MDQLLTPKTLGLMLGLAEQTIYNRHSSGGDLPPSIKIGRLLRFRPAEVEAWLINKQSKPTPPVAVCVNTPRRPGRPSKVQQIAARSI